MTFGLAVEKYIPDQKRGSTQIAAAGSFPLLDSIASKFFWTVCPFLYSCPKEPEIIYVSVPTKQHPVAVETKPSPTQRDPAISISNFESLITNAVDRAFSRLASNLSRPVASLDTSSFITDSVLVTRLNLLDEKFSKQINAVAGSISAQTTVINNTYETLGAVARVDNLDDIHVTDSHWLRGEIRDATIIGGNITATDFSGVLSESKGGTGTSTYAAGDLLYADAVDSLSRLPIGSNNEVLKIVGGVITWGSDATGSGGGSSAWSTTTDDLALYTTDPTDVVLVGASATSTTGDILEVNGNSLFRGTVTSYGAVIAHRFSATSSVASSLPYASTTMVSATTASTTNLFVSGAAGGILKTNSSGAVTLAIAGTDYLDSSTNLFSTTSATYFSSLGLAFSTTSSDAWKNARDFFSTTSASFFSSSGLAFSTTSANYFTASSTTIPKTYTSNIFTGLQQFGNASTSILSIANGSATTTLLAAATSTFGAGLQASALDVTGAATSTFANGISLAAGCIRMPDGSCLGSSSVTTLDSLSDVDTTGVAYGGLISYNGTTWVDIATSSLGMNSTDIIEGSKLFYQDARVQTYLDSIGKGYFFSTTSASAFASQGLAFSTTSADAWKLTRDFFSTTSASYFSSIGLAFSTTSNDFWKSANNFFSTTSAQYFVDSSSTIPKTYASNVFSGLQQFGNASTSILSVANGSATTTLLAAATSTFGAGLQASALNITSTTATSTFGNGLSLASGCFAYGGTCISAATLGASTFAYPFPSAATSTLLTLTGGLIAASSTINGHLVITGNSTTTNATTTQFAISGISSALLSTNASGGVIATSSLSSSYLTNIEKGFFFSTTSASYFSSTGAAFSTTSAIYLASTGQAFSTTSSDYWKNVNDFFSTTSAAYFVSTGAAFSTTSADAWKNVRDFFSTSSALYLASTGQTFSTTSADYFVSSSSTIPKTYTTNVFTALQQFGNASTTVLSVSGTASTSALVVSNLNATSCDVKASLTGVLSCGTDTIGSTFSYLFPNDATTTRLTFSGGLLSLASTTIGDGTQIGGLTINGGATTTGNAYFAGNVGVGTASPSELLHVASSGGDSAYFVGGVGIGTANPSGALHIAGSSDGNFIVDAAFASLALQTDGGSNVLEASWGGTDEGYINLLSGNSTKIRLDAGTGSSYINSGKVGIGTTTPRGLLTLGNTAGAQLLFEDINASADEHFGTIGFADGAMTFSSVRDSDLFANGWNMVIDTSGNVGIGTTSPESNQLAVYQDDSTSNGLLINMNHSSSAADALRILKGGTSGNYISAGNFVVTGGSNVGIGTTSPGSALSIQGSIFLAGNIVSTSTATSSLAGGLQTAALNITSTTATSTFNNGLNLSSGCFAIGGNCVTSGGSSFAYPFINDATTTLLTFTGLRAFASSTIGNGNQSGGLTINGGATTTGSMYVAGNVGIGITSPTRKLSIDDGASTYLSFNNSGLERWVLGSEVGTPDRFVLYGGDGSTQANRFVVEENGDFGIASSSPWGKLSITNTDPTPSFVVEDASSPDSTPFIIDAGGNVGIGTSTPNSALNIYGDTLFAGTNRYANFGTTTGSGSYGFRDNAGTIEFKNANGTWQGVTTATTGPSFSVGKSGTQSINGTTLLTWETETFDTNNNFDLSTERFTPTVPGKYVVTLSVGTTDASDFSIDIQKNGAAYCSSYQNTGNTKHNSTSCVIDMNGTSDYITGTAYSGGTVNAASNATFTGALIAPVSATAGGWTNDGTQSYLIDSADRMAVGTTSAFARATIWGGSSDVNILEVVNSASTTALKVSATGFGTTTLSGLTISGQATSTSNVGFNLSSGCFAIGGVCLGGGSSSFSYLFPSNATSTLLAFNGGLTTTNATSSNLFSSVLTANIAAFGQSATSSFNSAGALTLAGGLNGPLQANAGVVSATTSIGVLYGGTGLTSAPAYGQLLLGNATGGYTLTATTSLGLPTFAYLFPNNATSTLLSFNGGASTTLLSANFAQFGATATTTITTDGRIGIGTSSPQAKLAVQGTDQSASTKSFEVADSTGAKLAEIFNDGLTKLRNLIVTASSTIGGGTQSTGLTINGGATTTGNSAVLGTGTSTYAGNVQVDGNLKVGTGSIYLKGSATSTFSNGVDMPVINLTSTTATSTGSNGFNLSAGCFSVGGTCIGATGAQGNPGGGTLLATYATSTPGSNVQVVFTGAAGSQPSFSNGVLTLPSNTSYVETEVWGGGGGGGGVVGGGSGLSGNQSCFGTNSTACTSPTISATGGGAGAVGASTQGSGGDGGVGTGGEINLTGSGGGGGHPDYSTIGGAGGLGGSAPRGGGGGRGPGSISGAAFGGGGTGAFSNTSGQHGGGGGGGGGYAQKLVTSLSGSYYYTVGSGGAGGSSGGGSGVGGAGGTGGLVIKVYTSISANGTSGGQLLGIYSTSTPGSNVQVNLNGVAGSAPSFSAGVLTLPSNASTVIVHTWGAGGGGGGGGSSGGSTGGTGNNSCFGTNSTACTSPILTVTGGGGGSQTNNGGPGGAGSGGDVNLTGGAGGEGLQLTGTVNIPGGTGGSAPYGGGGGIAYYNVVGADGAPFGGGAGGGGSNTSNNGYAAGGGGYSKKLITSPSGTFYYTIGSGGTAGTAGTGGVGGGTGGGGGIVIEVYATGLTSGSVGNGTAGQLPYFASAGSQLTATSSLFLSTSGAFGIGTSTPWAMLSVTNAGSNPSFIVEDSASPDTSAFIIDGSGNVGIGTSTPWAKFAIQASGVQSNPLFEVASTSNATKFLSVAADGFGTTTLSGLNISGYATSTSNVGFNLSGGCFALGGTCLTASSLGAFGYLFPSNATSTLLTFSGGLIAASSTVNGNLVITGNATTTNATTTNFAISGIPNALLSTNSLGSVIATSSLGSSYLTGIEKGFFFSSTSADYFTSTGATFSTTSSDYWKTVRDFFSTTSAQYFVHSSTTIPKTYTSNIFTGLQQFGNASTSILSIANGSATTTLLATATSTFGAGVQTTALNVTSSTASSTFANGLNLSGGCFAYGGNCISASTLGASTFSYPFPSNATTSGLLILASTTIGAGGQTTGLTINGGATTTGNAYFAGNVGIGTTTPTSKLHVYDSGSVGNGSLNHMLALDDQQNINVAGSGSVIDFRGFAALHWGSIGGYTPATNVSAIGIWAPSAQGQASDAPGLLLNNSGNVGIGTTTPQSKLSVNYGAGTIGAGQTKGIVVTSMDNTCTSSLSLDFSFQSAGNPGARIASPLNANCTGQELTFSTTGNYFNGSTEAMRIDKSGNVGIGTTTPLAMLHVNGDTIFKGPIIDVRAYGALGNGSTNDRNAIQAAIDAAVARGGGTVFFPKTSGDYRVDTSIDLGSNIRLLFDESAAIDFSNASVGDHLFVAAGSIGSAVNLSSNGTTASTSINVADTSDFTANDLVRISSTANFGGFNNGEYHYVKSKNAAYLMLDDGLWDDYPTASSAVVRKITPIRNVTIENATIKGGGAGEAHYGIELEYTENIKIIRLKSQDMEDRAIQVLASVNVSVEDSRIVRSNDSNLGYGVAAASAQWLRVSNSFFDYDRHAVSVGGSSSYPGPTRFLTVSGNHIYGATDAGLDAHPASQFIVMDGNTITNGAGGAGGADGIIVQGSDAVISNNVINGSARHGIAIQPSNGKAGSITIQGNHISKVGVTGIAIATFSGSPLTNLIIASNVIDDPAAYGIELETYESGSVVSQFSIAGNAINSAGNSGIYVYAENAPLANGSIVSNTVKDSGSENIYLVALDGQSVQSIVVSNNSTSGGTFGIRGATSGAGVISNVQALGNAYKGTGTIVSLPANNVFTSATSSFYGIGTTSPWQSLSVAGTVATNALLPNGPYTNNLSLYDLGTTTARWNALWAGAINVGTSTFSLKSDSNSSLGIYTAASGGGTQAMTLTSSGNVGIGTTSPWGLLSVNANALAAGTPQFVVGSSTATHFIVANNGNVGIGGTTSPMSKLDVKGDINFSGKLLEDGVEILGTMIAPFAGSCPSGWSEYTAARGRTVVGTPSGGTNAGTVGSALTDLGTRTIADSVAHTHAVDPPNTSVAVSDPGHSHVQTQRSSSGGTETGDGYLIGSAAGSGSVQSNTTGITASVNIGSFTSGSTGSASVDVSMPYIQLTYCQKAAGADIAEWIPTNEDLSKETIISVDPDNREKVVASKKEYDNSVIGIVATKPGWLLGQETKDSVQLALAGRVPVRISLKNGEIKPGDPITTSSIPGVGMKATKAGPILGKAMEALNETSQVNSCVDPTTDRAEKCGTALVFVNVSWWAPTTNADAEETDDTGSQTSSSYFEPIGFDDGFENGDLADMYYLDAPQQNHPEVLEKVGRVAKATGAWGRQIVGVISTRIGGEGDLLRRVRSNNKITQEIRLVHSGKAEVKIAADSEPIIPGDAIAVSAEEGHAMRATKPGIIVGRALEAWSPEMDKETISIMVGISWYDAGALITSYDGFEIEDTEERIVGTPMNSFNMINTSAGSALNRVGVFSDLHTGDLKTGSLASQGLLVAGNVRIENGHDGPSLFDIATEVKLQGKVTFKDSQGNWTDLDSLTANTDLSVYATLNALDTATSSLKALFATSLEAASTSLSSAFRDAFVQTTSRAELDAATSSLHSIVLSEIHAATSSLDFSQFATRADIEALANMYIRKDGTLAASSTDIVPLSATTSAKELTQTKTSDDLASTSSTTSAPWIASFATTTEMVKNGITSLQDTAIHVLGKAVYAVTGVFERIFAKELVAENIYADTVTSKKLCLEDICITKSELENLLKGGQTAAAATPTAIAPPPEDTNPPTATSTEPVASTTPVLADVEEPAPDASASSTDPVSIEAPLEKADDAEPAPATEETAPTEQSPDVTASAEPAPAQVDSDPAPSEN